MKVAIIHNQFSTSGGMESYLLTLLDGFLEAGDDVHIHTYKVDQTLAAKFNCVIHKTNLFLLPRKLRKYYFLYRYNTSFNKGEYDLSISLTRTSCQDISIIGGVHPQSVLLRKKGGLYRAAHDAVENKFEQLMLQNVPHVVAHSKIIQEEIITHYPFAKDKVDVLYPPINEKRFLNSSLSSEQPLGNDKFPVSANKITLLFPSLSHDRKGLKELMIAFDVLDPALYELVVVGDGKMRGRKLQSNINFLGYVDNMRALYEAVDYVVLPSHYEPFGLVVTEALECRTPVIISQSVGAAELVSPDEGIVLSDNAPDTLVQAITSLKKMTIAPHFAARNNLEVAKHIEALKQYACA